MATDSNSRKSTMKHTILYIEDDYTNRQLIQFIFSRREDLSLIEADSGSLGIQMAIKHQPKIILLDLSLPDINGYVVLEHLQSEKATSHIPVIAVSGSNLPEDIRQGLQAGLQGYITKPIRVMELYQEIDRALTAL